MKITVEVSGRHVHLSQAHLERLFGKGHELTPLYPISQRGQYATVETVDVQHNDRVIKRMRIVGPVRAHSQVELAQTDARNLGIDIPVRLSGNHARTPGVTMIGPRGRVKITQGVLTPQRHIHASPERARKAGLKNGSIVSVKISGARAITFHNVYVRTHPTYVWHCHVDTDEGNAAGAKRRITGILLKK